MMTTPAPERPATDSSTSVSTVGVVQRAMIINGGPEVLDLLGTVLHANHYSVVFVESLDHAYSRVRLLRPDMVILCTPFEDLRGLQVLSMIKLDEKTRDIPLLTIATDGEPSDARDQPARPVESAMFELAPAPRMN